MSSIKFNFAKFDKAVAFQILEQDPNFLGKRFIASNGLTIESNPRYDTNLSSYPRIYLRGNENSLKTSIHYFNSDNERDKFYNDVISAIDEFSKKKDKWQPI